MNAKRLTNSLYSVNNSTEIEFITNKKQSQFIKFAFFIIVKIQ